MRERTEVLDKLLVLLELLEGLGIHAGDAGGVGLIAVLLVAEHADLHAGAGDVGQQDGAGETLVLGGVVVLASTIQ